MKTKQQRAAEFIAKAKEIHGDKFDYSAVKYETARKKVEIICPEHGSFWSTPDGHLGSKTGCRQCGNAQQRLKKLNPAVIGETYGHLTVTGFSHWTVEDRVVDGLHHPLNRGHWIFKCSACGNEHYTADIAIIRYRASKLGDNVGDLSCGCHVGKSYANKQASADSKERIWQLLELQSDTIDFSNAQWHGFKNPITGLYCKVHQVEYTALPTTIQSGNSGCDICGREKGGDDNVTRFLKDEQHANSPCSVYLAEIDKQFIKPGIAKDVVKRADSYYSRYLFVSPTLTRCEAWTIEQCLLTATRFATPTDTGSLPVGWGGITEIRDESQCNATWFIKAYNKLYEMLCEIGWLALYEQRNIWNY